VRSGIAGTVDIAGIVGTVDIAGIVGTVDIAGRERHRQTGVIVREASCVRG
jgi:hypothetical protein